MAEHERHDPAITGYDMRYDDPRANPIAFLPIAFLPVDDEPEFGRVRPRSDLDATGEEIR